MIGAEYNVALGTKFVYGHGLGWGGGHHPPHSVTKFGVFGGPKPTQWVRIGSDVIIFCNLFCCCCCCGRCLSFEY